MQTNRPCLDCSISLIWYYFVCTIFPGLGLRLSEIVLEFYGLLGRASMETLCCVLKQDPLSFSAKQRFSQGKPNMI